MAIAFDSASAVQASGGSSSLTFSHTCSGSDRILFVCGTGNQGPTTTLTASYDGTGMTQIAVSKDSTGTGVNTYLWYMINPPSGTYNVVITASGNGLTGSSVSYTGVDQTTPIPENNATPINTTSGSLSKSLTTTVDNSRVIMTSRGASGSLVTAGANTTRRVQVDTTVNGGGLMLDSTSDITPAGSFTLNWTSGSQFYGGQVIASFAPAAGGGGGTVLPRKALLGVGR